MNIPNASEAREKSVTRYQEMVAEELQNATEEIANEIALEIEKGETRCTVFLKPRLWDKKALKDRLVSDLKTLGYKVNTCDCEFGKLGLTVFW